MDPAAEFESRTGRPRWTATPEERAELDREFRRRAGKQAAVESAAAQGFETRVEDAAREKLSQGMPAASSLGIDVGDLSPARRRLVIGRAWIAREAEAIPVLEERRAAFLKSLGMPATTRQELQLIESSVGAAVKAFYEAGSPEEGLPDLRKHEREVLIERLSLEDALAGEVSNGLLEEAETQIEVQRRLVAALEERVPRWESDCLVEIAGTIGPKVKRLVGELRAELSVLTALGQCAAGSDFRHIAGGTKLALGCPWPWGEEPDLEVAGGDRVSKIVREWRRVLTVLREDPRAKIVGPGSREVLPAKIAAIETAAADLAPKAVGILKRVAQAITPAAQRPAAEPEPAALPYTFTDYHDAVH
jgi:hypothetical protein